MYYIKVFLLSAGLYEKLIKDYDLEANSTFNTYELIDVVASQMGKIKILKYIEKDVRFCYKS